MKNIYTFSLMEKYCMQIHKSHSSTWHAVNIWHNEWTLQAQIEGQQFCSFAAAACNNTIYNHVYHVIYPMFTTDLDSTKASGSMIQLINGLHWNSNTVSHHYTQFLKGHVDQLKQKEALQNVKSTFVRVVLMSIIKFILSTCIKMMSTHYQAGNLTQALLYDFSSKCQHIASCNPLGIHQVHELQCVKFI